LALLKNRNLLPKEIHLEKIRVELDLTGMYFYLSNNQNALFSSFELPKIQKIVQDKSLEDFFCFNIVVNKVDEKEKLLKGPLTLCAKNTKQMNEWVKAIGEFKQCNHDDNNIENENQVLVDFSKVNKLLSDKTTLGVKPEIKKLFYAKASPYIESQKRKRSRSELIKKLNHKRNYD